MALVYLDVDDEITSAASRMRTATEARVALVLPGGSRLGTSRINFRLLAREAQTNGRILAIVSPEASTRALAASAGLPVFGSVFEYEAAQVAPPVPEDATRPDAGPAAVAAAGVAAAGAGAAAGAAGASSLEAPAEPLKGRGRRRGVEASSATAASGAAAGESIVPGAPEPVPPVVSVGSTPVTGGVGGAGGPPPAGIGPLPARPRRRPSGLLVSVSIAAAFALVVIGVLGFVFLPSASVAVVVRPEPLGPTDMTVTADPSATTTDVTAGIVPAERPTFDLAASGAFPATGKKVTETKATGSVRWQNCDPTSSYTIPRGTVVRTAGGTGFAIDETVFLPVALLAGNPPSITCQTRNVGVTASEAGEGGNVGAGTITSVPAAYNSVVVRVTNPAATSGGTRTETKLVSQKDLDAATKSLTAELATQLTETLADPSKLPPDRDVFADTASTTAPVAAPDPTTLVGQEVDSFDLAMTATGSVTAVDVAAVRRVAEERLTASVPAGKQLVEGSVRIDVGEPTVAGQAVTYPVTAGAQVIQPVDAAEVRQAVAGKSLEEARAALVPYGDATITVWPDWVTTVPTYDFRLQVTVTTELPEPSPGASSGPGGPATPAGTGAP